MPAFTVWPSLVASRVSVAVMPDQLGDGEVLGRDDRHRAAEAVLDPADGLALLGEGLALEALLHRLDDLQAGCLGDLGQVDAGDGR
ncbi:hypothetical protein ACFQ1I_26380 [Kitasatospora arboriphila]